MNGKLKKTLSVIMTMCMVFSLLVFTSSAKEELFNLGEGTNYPFIFIHGMLGWGSNVERGEETPYWGFTPEDDVMTYLTEKGYKVYNPNVGCISSAWDRCCEMYAQLMGTVVDYGEVHSKNAGHSRYGKDYTGKAIMGEAWDMNTPLNLVGHSFGGATVRLFASLIAYGSEEEIEGTAGEISPLFKGGHEELIYSVTTLAAPHNGSVVSNYMNFCVAVPFAIALLINKTSISDEPKYDMNATQWGITDKMNPLGCMKFALSKDHVGYDLTLKGAEELNKKIKTVKSAYYFSFYSSVTEKNCLGYYQIKDSENIFDMMKYSGVLICNTINVFVDGQFLDKSWGDNDGIVPVNSAMYPFGEEHTDYVNDDNLQTGIWYVMPKLIGVDHVDYCNGPQTGAFGSRDGYFNFYETFVSRICSL